MHQPCKIHFFVCPIKPPENRPRSSRFAETRRQGLIQHSAFEGIPVPSRSRADAGLSSRHGVFIRPRSCSRHSLHPLLADLLVYGFIPVHPCRRKPLFHMVSLEVHDLDGHS
jgi:hypothetical protein